MSKIVTKRIYAFEALLRRCTPKLHKLALFNKSNNVSLCTMLCHAGRICALIETRLSKLKFQFNFLLIFNSALNSF